MNLLDKTGLTYFWGKLKAYFATKTELNAKQDALTFDSAPTSGSTNVVTSGGIYTAIHNASPSGNFVPKSGATMDPGAVLTFGTSDYVPYDTGYGVQISKEGIVLDDPDDAFYMTMETTGGAFVTSYTQYCDGWIQSSPSGTPRVYNFPNKDGTFAMTSDIPTFYTGTSDPASSLGSDGDIYLKISS